MAEQAGLPHAGLVRLCMRRFAGRGLNPEELYQQGCLGLMAALRRFDPDRGTRFSTYAVPLILTEMKRYADLCTPVRVPRDALRLRARMLTIRASLQCELGREPSADELAARAGLSPAELCEALAAQEACAAASMDAPLAPDGPPRHELLADRGGGFVSYLMLVDVIARLPRPLGSVLRLRCLAGLSQSETAHALGMSQSAVSRAEARARDLLRVEVEP